MKFYILLHHRKLLIDFHLHNKLHELHEVLGLFLLLNFFYFFYFTI